ncbi:peptidoglycan recognition protein isoform X1 [Nasonia vitripennis]|uniref:Peptidoglycan-recognition protein n=1 Tax=Nasonia vitripennis TaxID=7425 RepID=A0A7M7IXG0_NASVI|nr:peptidoglycan recognition protein isoform X1 [Nasonia vitripennis]
METPGAAAMPLWEKIVVLFVITISVTSLYAVIYTYLGHHQADNSTVSRIEWGAQPPMWTPTPLPTQPTPYVIISHTATDFCNTRAKCIRIVRVAQSIHIESNGWNDIAYNFLVGGDGNIYEGRGWDIQGAHTYFYNHKSIGISFIGTFTNAKPTAAQLYAAHKLLRHGLQTGKLTEDYKLLGHRQCSTTESPGEQLYKIIQTWKHWSPTP